MPEKPRILFFVPMYNCERQIGRVLERIGQQVEDLAATVIVVDNGSRDGSLAAARAGLARLACPGRLLVNNANYNLGGSHKVAFKLALRERFDWITVVHGDDQADPADIADFLKGMPETAVHLDAWLGSRFSRGSRRIGYAWHRTLGNLGFNCMFSLVAGRWLPDLGSGLNAFRVSSLREAFWSNLADDLTFNNHLLLALVQRRLRIRFFPISWREEDQVSNVRLVRQSWRTLRIICGFAVGRSRYLAHKHTTRDPDSYSATEAT
jgi:dolichol-phosphate mannosyltransferase